MKKYPNYDVFQTKEESVAIDKKDPDLKNKNTKWQLDQGKPESGLFDKNTDYKNNKEQAFEIPNEESQSDPDIKNKNTRWQLDQGKLKSGLFDKNTDNQNNREQAIEIPNEESQSDPDIKNKNTRWQLDQGKLKSGLFDKNTDNQNNKEQAIEISNEESQSEETHNYISIMDEIENLDVREQLAFWKTQCKQLCYLQMSNSQANEPEDETWMYTVELTTGNKTNAGTTAKVFVILNSEDVKQKEGRKELNNSELEKNTTDRFHIRVTSNQTPLKCLLIGHDGSGDSPDWYCEEIIVKCHKTGLKQTFPCKEWIVKDGQRYRVLKERKRKRTTHAHNELPKTYPYEITITTGNDENTGTEANVFVELHGEDTLSSGKLSLPRGKFDRGKSHKFHKVLPVMLSPLTSVDVGHDNSGEFPDWYCEQVIVYSHTTGFKQTFPCQKWLQKKEDQDDLKAKLFENTELNASDIHTGNLMSGQISKEDGRQNNDGVFGMFRYVITITTGSQENAGTDAKIFITLFGMDSSSRQLPLSHCQLEPDSSVTFHRDVETDLGVLHKIEIGHDNSGDDPDWFLEKVTIYCVTTNLKQIFICRKWLSCSIDDCLMCRMLYADFEAIDAGKDTSNVFEYDITLVTGKKENAGTDAGVYISFHGNQQADIEKCRIPSGNCRRDTSYTFSIELPFAVDYVEVEHDNNGVFPDWFCDHVTVSCHNTGLEQIFRCKRWLSKTIGDGIIKRRLFTSHEFNKNGLKRLCKQYGRLSAEVEEACNHVVMQLLACSMAFKKVWPAYELSDSDRIVFVVVVEKGSNKRVRLPKSLASFDIVYREIDEASQDENEILKTETKVFSDEQRDTENKLVDVLKKSSKNLMDLHSNLTMISASPVKSMYFANGPDKHKVERKPCIVFYVGLKGLIPIREKPLPNTLGTYVTDVREGIFKLFNDNEDYLARLKIGCSVGENISIPTFGGTGGTLGAFVDLPNGKVGCITSAHTLFSEDKLINLKGMNTGIDITSDDPAIYQPAPAITHIQNNTPFGYVSSAVYQKGGDGSTGVEVGVITISDQSRNPENGKFPKVVQGSTEESQPDYTSGDIYTYLPESIKQYSFYKYGATTGFTRGAFRLEGVAVRTSSMNVRPKCELHNQIEICSVGTEPFAKPGDSGALVLLATNNDLKDLRAIGILTGGTTNPEITPNTVFFVTPIWEVLKALNLPLRLKNFCGQSQTGRGQSIETLQMREIVEIKTNMEELKTNINEKIDEINRNVDQNNKNVDGKFDKILEAINAKK